MKELTFWEGRREERVGVGKTVKWERDLAFWERRIGERNLNCRSLCLKRFSTNRRSSWQFFFWHINFIELVHRIIGEFFLQYCLLFDMEIFLTIDRAIEYAFEAWKWKSKQTFCFLHYIGGVLREKKKARKVVIYVREF